MSLCSSDIRILDNQSTCHQLILSKCQDGSKTLRTRQTFLLSSDENCLARGVSIHTREIDSLSRRTPLSIRPDSCNHSISREYVLSPQIPVMNKRNDCDASRLTTLGFASLPPHAYHPCLVDIARHPISQSRQAFSKFRKTRTAMPMKDWRGLNSKRCTAGPCSILGLSAVPSARHGGNIHGKSCFWFSLSIGTKSPPKNAGRLVSASILSVSASFMCES